MTYTHGFFTKISRHVNEGKKKYIFFQQIVLDHLDIHVRQKGTSRATSHYTQKLIQKESET